ncbi:DUF4230 domain-containing protein [Aridibaculum aurantiacum]|uniref:DUF4230 domain-containing protein n=1 Tax=Aridibaculum aurantiacum TaxID=2810307 RepID=UPI001A9564C2|nr:DUF4230 domain-containing protein [Aridibaculum aurantiacum]
MKMSFKNIVLLLVVLAVGFFIYKMRSGSSLSGLFTAKPVVIDETPILIKDIKAIGQLVTIVVSDEVVVSSVVPTKGSAFVNVFNKITHVNILPSADKQLVLIGKGKVMAGTDFSRIDSMHVKVTGDTATIVLPKATVTDAILNPSDFEVFEESGRWSNEEVNQVKISARQKMIDRAIANNILEKANNKARGIMEQFLQSAGFKVVQVSIQ